jgi:hypothetical protein
MHFGINDQCAAGKYAPDNATITTAANFRVTSCGDNRPIVSTYTATMLLADEIAIYAEFFGIKTSVFEDRMRIVFEATL